MSLALRETVVWNSPSVDIENNQLFIGTGENMSSPATATSDALIAFDLDTGAINWVFRPLRMMLGTFPVD